LVEVAGAKRGTWRGVDRSGGTSFFGRLLKDPPRGVLVEFVVFHEMFTIVHEVARLPTNFTHIAWRGGLPRFCASCLRFM
jgi:hypothetical protein